MMDTFFNDTNSDSFSESGSEGPVDSESVYGGQAGNIFSSLEESIRKIDDFLSFERGFMHGDIVCSVTDPSGQMGRVENIEMFVDVENVFGRVIKGVDSKKLLKIRSISVGDLVTCGPWIGRVDKVIDCVTVLFDDGAKCEIMTLDQGRILPISPTLVEDPQYPYYPGQRVQVILSNISNPARTFCGIWKENRDEGTVCAVEPGLVYVDWIASAMLGSHLSLPTPRLQASKNLTLLSCFSHANWQLGDWCILPIATDGQNDLQQAMHRPSTFDFGQKNISSIAEEICVIAKTRTKVDVLWQNGSCSLGLDSHTLCPVNIVDTHEFWPGQIVIEKGTCDDSNAFSSQKWGVVRVVDAKEKTVKIKWEYLSVSNRANNLEGDQIEEMFSAYELVEHPNYSYCFGDVVFRAVPSQFVNQDDEHTVTAQKNLDLGMEEIPGKHYPYHIGNVIGFNDGDALVRWASGHTTKVAPCEIVHIDKCEGSYTTSVPLEENIEALSEEMSDHDKQSAEPIKRDPIHYDGAGEDCKTPCESNTFSLPRAAIGVFTSIAVSLFGSTSIASSNGFKNLNVEESEPCISCTELQPIAVDGVLITKETFPDLQDVKIGESEKIIFSSNNPQQFSQFDMVCDCSDHHFVGDTGRELATSQVKRGWLKKVQQEWNILQADLPESIYVRVYEERMDLMRAAIVGAPGTPYHDGIFFPGNIHISRLNTISFNITNTQLVHYHSGGLRLNPNLYESGKVCLSLLNTWTGSGSEVWNPERSTILQVLLSLQALVLNEKPYFNEAGYDTQMGQAGGEKNSVSYNENAFLVTCKSMLYTLRKPPKHFEEFVEEHFRERSRYILMACKSYLGGAPLGWESETGKGEQVNQKGGSMGFKMMLKKLFPMLVDAFSKNGIDCNQFID